MLIESSKPLTVRLRSRTVHLQPGQAKEFSEEDGLKLLVKAKGKVRLLPPQTPPDWLFEWRYLAAMTSGLEADDPRLQPIMEALAVCDVAFLAGDFAAFTRATVTVEEAMKAR